MHIECHECEHTYRYVTAEGLSVGMGGVHHRAYLENADNDQVSVRFS